MGWYLIYSRKFLRRNEQVLSSKLCDVEAAEHEPVIPRRLKIPCVVSRHFRLRAGGALRIVFVTTIVLFSNLSCKIQFHIGLVGNRESRIKLHKTMKILALSFV